MHGDTPLIARTASGKYHAYYRFNGEDRLKLERVRPWGDDVPIDLLHSLLVVATPSKAPGGQYEFIRGRIHQLDDLPVMRGLEGLAKVLKGPPARISTSMRVTVSPGAKCATATAATAP